MIEINKTSKQLRKEIWDIAYKYKSFTTIERLQHIVTSIDNDTPTEIIIKLYDYLKDYDDCQKSKLYTAIATLLFSVLNIELPNKEPPKTIRTICCFYDTRTSGLYEEKSFAVAMLALDQKVNELQQSRPTAQI